MAAVVNPIPLRALVADDEGGIRKLVSAFLTKSGFECDTAEDGEQAAKMARERTYHAVVTDLAMPGRHGYSLAIELLELPQRPVVVVLTGLKDPRLSKDLLARGVDDVQFKPVQFGVFAAKIRALVQQRFQPVGEPSRVPRIEAGEYERRINGLARVPPVAQAAIDVFRLTTCATSELYHVAEATMRDSALIVEVLRLANSICFNPGGKKTSDVKQAVVRLGLEKVGELALALAAVSAVAQEKIPFFPLSHVWRKCLAAGICLKMVTDQADLSVSGLWCAAILQPMGRILLASAFPEVYEQLLTAARKDRRSLCSLEVDAFPEGTGATAAKVFAMWGIPEDIYRPLHYASLPFAALGALNDSLRRRVELVKTAGFLGELVAADFQAWDSIDLPPDRLLDRLGIRPVEAFVTRCREDLNLLVAPKADPAIAALADAKSPPRRVVSYARIQPSACDCIPSLLATAGFQVAESSEENAEAENFTLVNALESSVPHSVARLRTFAPQKTVILAEETHAERLQSCGRVVALPTTYGHLQEVCRSISRGDEFSAARNSPASAPARISH